MKARIEKKLSKRLVEIAPTMFQGAWIDIEVSSLAEDQGTRVSHILSVGGGTDYWGEGCDAYTAWQWLNMNWEWIGPFKPYPEGHESEGYPDIDGYKPTSRNLLKLAADYGRGAA
jgi:hypothetical protein